MERKHYLDWLRVLSTISILSIHTSGYFEGKHGTISEIFYSLFTYLFIWGVPAFVMLSGALWVDRKIATKKLFEKYILHIIVAYIFWSFFYAITNPFDDIKTFFVRWIFGHYHLWFCYMIVGLYIVLPIVWKVAQERVCFLYLLFLSFCITICVPTLLQIPALSFLSNIWENTGIYMGYGYIFYFLLGYFFSKSDISKRKEIFFYIIGALGVTAQMYGAEISDFHLFRLGLVCAVFTLCKNHLNRRCKPISAISKRCFGIYLIHPLILDLLNLARIWQTDLFAVGNRIIVITITFGGSLFLTTIISKIPRVGKWLV